MKDKIQQAICLALYGIAIYLWAVYAFWYIFAFLFTLHFIEFLVKGRHVGKQAGKSSFDALLMTLLFGFTWWLPLEKSLHNMTSEEKA